jgi:hypothetical protein
MKSRRGVFLAGSDLSVSCHIYHRPEGYGVALHGVACSASGPDGLSATRGAFSLVHFVLRLYDKPPG